MLLAVWCYLLLFVVCRCVFVFDVVLYVVCRCARLVVGRLLLCVVVCCYVLCAGAPSCYCRASLSAVGVAVVASVYILLCVGV